MTELFLILHRVRGKPAFDIAIRIQIGAEDETKSGWTEEAWLIPTSGHRAYPWDTIALSKLGQGNGMLSHGSVFTPPESVSAPIPRDWPDHYSCNNRPLPKPDTYTVQAKAKGMLEALGLVKKVEIERRD